MEIYIGNIPKGTRPAEIRKLLKDTVKQRVFQRLFEKMVSRGHLDEGVDVEIVKGKSNNGAYRFGRVIIDSAPLAYLMMESPIEANLRGTDLEVREFVKRDSINDRRSPNWGDLEWEQPCRRVADRRKKH